MARLREVPFVKGHGTGNDFVLLPDLDGRLDLTADQVRFLCDRRFGIGADGVLRVVRTEHMPELAEFAAVAEYCMDYRNGDGSLAEMCGNGIRVFMRYLDAVGLVDGPDAVIATRGGLRSLRINSDRSVTVDMGPAAPGPTGVEVQVNGGRWAAIGVLVPNPHAVVFVDDLADAGDLRAAPELVPGGAFESGANVEFVHRLGPDRIEMRVHERGVGETLSCGTGACAAAWASAWADGSGPSTVAVRVPGGELRVEREGDGRLLLTGPADLVAKGTVLLP